MTWIFFGWMLLRLVAVTDVVSTDPGNTMTLDGGSGQPPSGMDGGSGQPPSKMDGGSGQPPSRI